MKGFRTLIAATGITIIGGLQQIGLVDLVPMEFRGVAIATIGLLMAVLRLSTTTPIARSE